MQNYSTNIYKNCRKNAGLTQEKAAELLHIGSRTLASYETGEIIPNDSIVCNMVDLYRVEHLGYLHLRENTDVGKRFLPDLYTDELAISVLKFQKEMSDVEDITSDMIEVACDGEIQDHEKVKWGKIERELKDVMTAAMSIIFSNKKRAITGGR